MCSEAEWHITLPSTILSPICMGFQTLLSSHIEQRQKDKVGETVSLSIQDKVSVFVKGPSPQASISHLGCTLISAHAYIEISKNSHVLQCMKEMSDVLLR